MLCLRRRPEMIVKWGHRFGQIITEDTDRVQDARDAQYLHPTST